MNLHGRWRSGIYSPEATLSSGVSNIRMQAARGKYEPYKVVLVYTYCITRSRHTIGLAESICHNCDRASHVIIPIHLVWQPLFRSEILQQAVDGVCEIDILIPWVDGDVVERVKLAAKIVV